MRRLILRWLITTGALYLAVTIVPGLHFTRDLPQLFLVGAVLGLVNGLLRPLLTVLTCPLIVLTLGLWLFAISGLLLLITGWLSQQWGLGFRVDGFWPAFWGGLLIGVVNAVLSVPRQDGARRA